jgi:anthranilate 1,2-dioxygenase small subunit
MSDMELRQRLCALQDEYITALDTAMLDAWPEMFVEDCRYEIIPKENVDMGLPAPLMLCEGKGMLRDRVVSLLNANIFAPQIYRHFVSGLQFQLQDDGSIAAQWSYLVINTSMLGESVVYQTGRYHDLVVEHEGRLRFKAKRCIYDTSRVQTLLAIPV